MCFNINAHKFNSGIALLETIVAIGVFMIIAIGAYQAYLGALNATRLAHLKTTAVALANEQLEIIRNLPYADVGIVGGIPGGKIPRERTISRNNTAFKIVSTIRNIDDPFDGVTGGRPADTSPADYKLVHLEISCPSCKNFKTLSFATHVAPLALEASSTNGSLFIRVFDANGLPVPEANVHIENVSIIPQVIIDETTDNKGFLQIVDTPPGSGTYDIRVTKAGYSSERTYQIGAPTNPNPIKPHATVLSQQLTQTSFSIDRTSTLNFSTVSPICGPINNLNFSLAGSKPIGTSPDVLKYTAAHSSDATGSRIITGMEWDAYTINLTDSVYDLSGTIPAMSIMVGSNLSQDIKIIVIPKIPQSLMVTVKDASTMLPLSDANITIQRGAFNNSLITGRGFLNQTDWSGGPGQQDFLEQAKFFSSDGNFEIVNPVGEIRLRTSLGRYVRSGSLVSSSFDTGSPSNFYQILWQPQSQPPGAGSGSIRFQIATNNDRTTWNFIGPDGTANTFYTSSGANINTVHNGHRYLRYKVFFNTIDQAVTPILADVQFTFTSSCVPPGQVLFNRLSNGTYNLIVSKAGYQTFTDTVIITSPWQKRDVILNP